MVVMAAFATLRGALSAFGGVLLAGYASKAAQAMGDPYLLPGNRRGGARWHLDPRRARQLPRHGGRRNPDHVAAVDPVGDADGGIRPPRDLRRGHRRDAVDLWRGKRYSE
jgi:hypothetical protein